MILINKTIEKFGYNPENLSAMSGKRIIYACVSCGKESEITKSDYTRKVSKMCLSCALKAKHNDKNSGYNTESYRKNRSQIAKLSNQKRKINSEKHLKYLEYLEDIKNNKISFKEIADKLGLDDSTVCKFFHNNYGIKSKISYSVQEKEVGDILKKTYSRPCFSEKI